MQFLIAYAIFRYQLLDISVIIRKGLLYSALTATTGMIYFLAVFLALNLFHLVTGYQIFLLTLVLAALTAVVMQPLRDRMQAWVDKILFREKFCAGLMLQRLSHTAASVLPLDRLTDMILDDILTTMHISRGAFFIKDEKVGDYRLRSHKGSDPAPLDLRLSDQTRRSLPGCQATRPVCQVTCWRRIRVSSVSGHASAQTSNSSRLRSSSR